VRLSTSVNSWLMILALIGSLTGRVCAEDLRHHIRISKDYRPVVRPLGITGHRRWDRWVLMPWRHRWSRPYGEELAAAMKQAGFNGGVCDFLPRADAQAHQKHGMLWYLDHAAGKGDLHLSKRWRGTEYRAAYRRPKCLLDAGLRQRLKDRLTHSVKACLAYPSRIAYALDDEISWSTLANPCRWDNHPLTIRDFKAWLVRQYGNRGAILRQWDKENERFLHRMATPDDFQHLYRRPFTQWNLSPWCDALSYMDSQLLNLVGDLVTHANTIDPTTPCGIVGAQGPSPYGGYDYTKLMRKVEFLEVYDIGAAMEIARSFNTQIGMPLVTSGAGDPEGPDGVWWDWYGLAHGYRGAIVFADGWFGPDMDTLRLGPGIRKLAQVSRKLIGAQWRHDGVAIYYSHPSIQVSWFIDCHAHGRTWMNRLSSMNNQLASSNAAFWAWTRLLEDARLQYDFVSDADVILRGLDPAEYKVLILPRVLALSDEEVERITRYVEEGGVVIADHMVGLFDRHGRGRTVPALDKLLDLADHPPAMAGNVFGGRLLSEFDAETYWRGTFLRAGSEIWRKCRRARGLPVAERGIGEFIAGRQGKAWVMLMNVSLAEYCLHRMRRSPKADEIRTMVARLLRRAGVRPRLSLRVDNAEPAATEATYWHRNGRLYVSVVANPLRLGSARELGGPAQPGGGDVKQGTVQLSVRFAQRQTCVVDEIVGSKLGSGVAFQVPWKTDEAAVISMDDPPTVDGQPSGEPRKGKVKGGAPADRR